MVQVEKIVYARKKFQSSNSAKKALFNNTFKVDVENYILLNQVAVPDHTCAWAERYLSK